MNRLMNANGANGLSKVGLNRKPEQKGNIQMINTQMIYYHFSDIKHNSAKYPKNALFLIRIRDISRVTGAKTQTKSYVRLSAAFLTITDSQIIWTIPAPEQSSSLYHPVSVYANMSACIISNILSTEFLKHDILGCSQSVITIKTNGDKITHYRIIESAIPLSDYIETANESLLIEGYDKDRDIYETICGADNLISAKTIMSAINYGQMYNVPCLSEDKTEFDWLQAVDSNATVLAIEPL